MTYSQTLRSFWRAASAVSLVALLVACGSSDPGAALPTGSGGNVAATGGAAIGGASGVAKGGSGTTAVAQGGGSTSSSGGSITMSGGTNTGGSSDPGVGGAAQVGGSSPGGASTTVGGASPGGSGSGGASSKGGSSSGGGSANGGASSTVGGVSSGGSGNGGASSAKGGTSSGGSAVGGNATGGTAKGGASSGGNAAGGSTVGGASKGGAATGGTTVGGAASGGAATGGAGTGVSVAASCSSLLTALKWPTANGTKDLGSGITVKSGQTYDGGMAIHNGSLQDCTKGDQGSTDPIIDVEDGGTVKNVIMGAKVGDGIHCKGSCTIDNVWFPAVCDDAISALGSGTVNITNSGFKFARDKTIQHNGTATVNINNVYAETVGKVYRSCGEGCSESATRKANISNVIAIGASEVAGVGTNDTVTMKNICMYRTPKMCDTYESGSDTKTTIGSNGFAEGPTKNCVYTPSDAHALVDRVTGSLPTEIMCPGPNASVGGVACVSGFESCLRNCTPGSYGFRSLSCSGGRYVESTCNMPTDSTAFSNLDGATKAASASGTATKNATCSTQWAWAKDSSASTNYCVCVMKPGYYQESTGSAPPASWIVWDCWPQWW
jgi:hypothetical protein